MAEEKVNQSSHHPTTPSILEKTYIQPTRPYSQNELKDIRNKNTYTMRLDNSTIACHDDCGHFYRVKSNGRKAREIRESGNNDVGNCSVCWKLHKTPRRLRQTAENLASVYQRTFSDEMGNYQVPDRLDYDTVDTETCFYIWLYTEC